MHATSLPRVVVVMLIVLLIASAFPPSAGAGHSWGNYHWARTSNPFTLKLVDSLTSTWDPYLAVASTDWTASGVLDTLIEAGSTSRSTRRQCPAPSGKVRVCNHTYGFNGWLGVAGIYVFGDHITKGYVKLNDSYFNNSTYNTPAWRQFVMCQEIGHEFGLDHTDEIFDNPNQGTCMDYTNDPDGGEGGAASGDPSNEHPNAHDYEQLETIYEHTDSTTTVGTTIGNRSPGEPGNSPAEWGQAIRWDQYGQPVLFLQDFGRGRRLVTWVFWALPGTA